MNATCLTRGTAGAFWAALAVGTSPLRSPLAAQDPLGGELWRVVGVTVPVPYALAQGSTASFWNPAQRVTAPALAGDVIQTPDAIAASGILAVIRTGSGRLGSWGLELGQVDIGDIIRTSLTPDPEGTVPVYTRVVGLTWALTRGSTSVGATVGGHDSRLDQSDVQHWTADVGVVERLGDVLTLAAATHFFYRFTTSDPSQDLYAAVEWRAWHGPLWTGSGDAALRLRYGATLAHGAGTDHEVGLGFDLGSLVAVDGMLVRENTYGNIAWRGVAGFHVLIGRYGVTFARDAGVNDVGSSYRVGLEWRLQ